MTAFQPGDRVRHNPTGEEWMLAKVYGSYVVPAGWPVSHAIAADCTLIARDDTCTCTTLAEQNACTKSCDAVLL
jgi:hypothetical protein